jgi:hypothetical protein
MWPSQRDATVIPDRTHRNAKQFERWLIEQHGEDYAAVVTRAGTVRSARLRTAHSSPRRRRPETTASKKDYYWPAA